jgi:hypothetical protein
MSANDKTQAATDRLLGVKERQIIVDPPGHSDAKSGRKDVYTQAHAAAICRQSRSCCSGNNFNIRRRASKCRSASA